jgi:hypothetical protein
MPASRLKGELAPRLALVGAIVWAGISAACVGPFAPSAGRSGPGPAGGTPSAPLASIAAGAPIIVTATTPQLAAPSDDATLTPIAAYGSELLLAQSSAGGATPAASGATAPSSYKLWNPATGALAAVPSLDAPAGMSERVLGAWQNWVLVARSPGAQASSGSLLLQDLKTGEVRELTADADTARGGGTQISADGHVAWLAGSAGSSALRVYDIASGSTSAIPNRFSVSRRFSLQADHLASLSGTSGQIVVRDLMSRSSQTVSAGSVLSMTLSSDGRSLIWIERSTNDISRLLVRDLVGGTTVQVLSGAAVGFGLSVSGQYVSWQPRPGAGKTVAGVYNLQTRELRLLQAAPSTVPYLATVLGNWFVWTQGVGQAPAAAPVLRAGGNPGASLYLVKLGP